MFSKINPEDWVRKDHFNFFNQFEEPFFSVTANVDCTNAYRNAKQQGLSFFLYYLHKSLCAVNAIENFKYRIQGDEVLLYDMVNVSTTINRNNGTFGFAYIDFDPDVSVFVKNANAVIAEAQDTTGLIPSEIGENVIHYSAIPWINFTSLSHARKFSLKDSIPKISFGKMTEINGLRQMPVSITVHHGLMDGLHVGQYLELFQQLLDG